MAIVVVGVPVLLVTRVGNPWPGRSRIEMRDDVAILVGLLAALAWLVWLRFVVALVVEVRAQLAELRAADVAPPERSCRARRTGPFAGRCRAAGPAPRGRDPHPRAGRDAERTGDRRRSGAAAGAPGGTRSRRRRHGAGATGAFRSRRRRQRRVPWSSRRATRSSAWPAATSVTATAGGRSSSSTGTGRRSDGARLVTPSAIRVGWTLELPGSAAPPASPAAPYASAATITIEQDDTLWDLARDHLAGAGAEHDDTAVAGYVQVIVDANPGVIEDPNVIDVGEQFSFPAVGTPPPPPPATMTPPAAATPPHRHRCGAGTAAGSRWRRCHQRGPGAVEHGRTTTTTTPLPLPPAGPTPAPAAVDTPPSPIGVGEAALLSAGVLALLAARRRHRLRGSLPRARVPEPKAEMVAAERRLRSVDAGERLLRVDIAIRAAAASLVDTGAQIAVVQVGVDGAVELVLTSDAVLPPPWDGAAARWILPGSTPVELLAEAARSVGAPVRGADATRCRRGRPRGARRPGGARGAEHRRTPTARRRRRAGDRGDAGDVDLRRGGQPHRCRPRRCGVPRPSPRPHGGQGRRRPRARRHADRHDSRGQADDVRPACPAHER